MNHVYHVYQWYPWEQCSSVLNGCNKDKDHSWTYLFNDNSDGDYCTAAKMMRVLSVASSQASYTSPPVHDCLQYMIM